jgi:poly(A) polymerase
MKPAPESMQAAALRVVRRLQEKGHETYWVGGCVRDILLGREPADYDVATSALPPDIEGAFHKTIPVGRQFGVVAVVEGRHTIQVATFRAEGDYRDGRHPEKVKFSDARADALRRDFTINGLFHDPVTGEMHDWVGGRADIEAHRIRTIGNPEERFSEDHLRMLRAVRFAAQLGFDIERGTMKSLSANAAKIVSVSAERIRDELLKLLAPAHAPRGLDLLHESGLLNHVLPEFTPTITSEQSPEFHPEGTVFEHVRLMLRHIKPEAHSLLPWAAILHDIGKPATFSRDPVTGMIHNYGHEKIGAAISEDLLKRLRFPRKDIDLLVQAVRCHMQFKDAPKMRKATVRRIAMRPTFHFEMELHRIDCLGSSKDLSNYDYLLGEAEELSNRPEIKPPLLNGDDLAALGMKPSPAMGRLLAEIRDLQLQEALTSREAALEFAKTRLHRKR